MTTSALMTNSRALDRDRRPATGRVRLAEAVADELDAGHVAVLAEDLDRAGEELHPDALALGLAELLLVDDQLAPGPAVDDRDVLGAVAEARPRAVHRGVAAADDDDVLADVELLAEVRLLHEVDAVVDALEVGAGDVERDRVHRAGGDRDRVEVALELVERDVLADRRVEDERHPEPLDESDVHLDRLARQAERRDADEHRPAAVRQRVEDGAPEALHRQLAGDGDPGRPGPDDRDPLVPRRDLGHDVGDAGCLVPLDEEPLHRPDGQRPVDVAAAASPLARGRADVRAHRGDRVRLARQDVALLEPALGGEVEVAAAVRPDGAGFLALDVALEPGRIDGLNEEFLVGIDRQGRGRAFLCAGFPGVSGHEGGRSRPVVESTIRVLSGAKHGERAAADLTLAGSQLRCAERAVPSKSRELRRPRRTSTVTASEFAFLALGLLLGVAAGAALIEVLRKRPPSKRRSPRHGRRRTRSRVAERPPWPTSMPMPPSAGPARGGPGDQPQPDRDLPEEDLDRSAGSRRLPRTAPTAPVMERLFPARVPCAAAAGDRDPVGISISHEPDPMMAALRAKSAAGAGVLMPSGIESSTVTASVKTSSAETLPSPRTWRGDAVTPKPRATTAARPARLSRAPRIDRDAIAGACDEPRRIADERCQVATRAREGASAALEALRSNQHAYDDHIKQGEAQAATADPRAVRVAKEAAQQAFREARTPDGRATTSSRPHGTG